jgi:ribonucleoside-diphosphate reductase alpha chain
MRTANTAAYIPDEFMQRVKNGDEWYLFDPKETPDLVELYGQAFSKRYAEYITKAENGGIAMWKKLPAVELMKKIIVALQGTSHPWLTWKDTINNRALNNNTGTIHMSNLCTEICLPQDKNNIAVCNLASLNLATHFALATKDMDWDNLESSVRIAIRHLDNLVDINVLPIAEARRSDQENRAVGLGVMGFADIFEQMGWPYDSEESYDFVDEVCEFISYIAIDESASLAKERGPYTHFAGSRWAKGWVPYDSLAEIQKSRGVELTVTTKMLSSRCDWESLRTKVKQGMRNATLLAVAPNANIGLLAGTVPGFDVRFAQVFSRNKISGKYLDINFNLVKDLKAHGIWEKVKDKIIASQGDIATIAEIPESIRAIYKTSFSTSPYGVIEVAARAQKWIDQAISRNMYLETRDTDEIIDIYMSAWQKGLKSTYYCHMKPRHTAEQSTTSVNKRESLGKVGFAALRGRSAGAQESTPSASSAHTSVEVGGQQIRVWASDPSEQNQCDSCQ